MKKNTIVLAVVLLASIFAVGQEKASVFGGWQYLSIGDGGTGLGSTSVPKGFDIDLAANLHKNVAVVADFSLGSKSESVTVAGVTATGTAKMYNFLFGPRLSVKSGKVTPFAETLIGIVHTSASGGVSGLGSASDSSNNFGFALGGGLDVAASKNVSVRLAKFDYEFVKVTDGHINNIRYATGLVFKF